MYDITEFDKFDLASALYWFCVDFHEGQTSKLYEVMCSLKYQPSVFERGPTTPEALEIYVELIEIRSTYPKLIKRVMDIQARINNDGDTRTI